MSNIIDGTVHPMREVKVLTTVNHASIVSALRLAVRHIEHMAAWITAQKAGYSFESLGEDMPEIRAAIPVDRIESAACLCGASTEGRWDGIHTPSCPALTDIVYDDLFRAVVEVITHSVRIGTDGGGKPFITNYYEMAENVLALLTRQPRV